MPARNEVLFALTLLPFLGLPLSACGGEGPADETGGAEGSDLGASLDGATSGSSGGSSSDGSSSGCSLGVAEGCASEVYEGEAVPLDIYLMFDQSGSMSTVVDEDTGATRMDIVRSAVEAFLLDSDSTGIGVGIGYFGHQPLGETTCDPDAYSQADVGVAALPANADAILDSLAQREPTGETPTGSAIRGACSYASSQMNATTGRHPVILLVTDGEPKAPLSMETCSPTLDDAEEAATACREDSGIQTYVLGVGPLLSNLDSIAAAGGTDSAYLAELDSSDQVLDGLRSVRNSAVLPCELNVERAIEVSTVDPSQSRVAYIDGECQQHELPKHESANDCEDASGFYFDDPDAPTRIVLCESTCGDVRANAQQLYFSFGCDFVVK